MKKKYILLLAIPVIVIAGYLYLRFALLKSKDFKPDQSKAKSIIDPDPELIAKLQQLVKDGSGSLYKLEVNRINVELSNAGISMTGVLLLPDSNVLTTLKQKAQMPDDIFKIKADSLFIAGIGINSLLHKDQLDLKAIYISNPVIEIFHKSSGMPVNNSTTLYQKVSRQFKKISIKEILVQHGTIINHDILKNKINTIKDLSIKMNDLLIDSSTQHDKSRFLFAKDAAITTRNYVARTADSLYFLKFGSVNISTAANKMTLLNVLLEPRLSKQQFEAKLTTRKNLYHFSLPEIILSGINWWQLANGQSLVAKEALVNKGTLKVFLDRSLPFGKLKQNNFPHQLLMRISNPVYIPKTTLRHLNLIYSEYNPGFAKTGIIYLDDINGKLFNLTNMPQQIKLNHQMVFQSSGLFMHKALLQNNFRFDLSKYKTGNFTLTLEVGKLDSAILNPITAPMAEFMFKKGIINKGTVYLEGDNSKATGKGILLYYDLNLVGLKMDKDESGKLKKKAVLSFIGNLLLIKNSNPSKGDPPRQADVIYNRTGTQTFFSLIWKTIFTGILKIIGLPEGFTNKPY